LNLCKWITRLARTILLPSLFVPALVAGQNRINITAPKMNIPNQGVRITPSAVPGGSFQTLNPGLKQFPNYVAGGAVTTAVSPDKKTLLVLTSGFNRMNNSAGKQIPQDSTQYVFVFDISNKKPVQTQAIRVPNTYNGIAFDPGGKAFYVAGGVDDNFHIYGLGPDGWAESAGSPVPLGHEGQGVGLDVKPQAAGIAVSANGEQIVVANYYNDSISVLTKSPDGQWTKTSELDLRPGKIDPAQSGVPGGEYPYWVTIIDNDTAYISSLRDREIDVVNLGQTPRLVARIHLKGQPDKMCLGADGKELYVVQDETDSVAVIDTASNKVTDDILVGGPPQFSMFKSGETGDNTNSLALAPDGKTLYVTNGTANDVAVVSLQDKQVLGVIPTGLYPDSVSLSGDGSYIYVANAKSPTGPNPGFCYGRGVKGKTSAQCESSNLYDLQLIKAGLQSYPVPTSAQLKQLTDQVAQNDNYQRKVSRQDWQTMAALRKKIKHVIYIIKENRTYDQVLGDLSVGNGDPSLTEFGQAITPNLHNLALNFVDLDNFYDRSEVSMDGWAWSTSARAPDIVEKTAAVNYAGRGLSYDTEGDNRNINVGLATQAEREAADPLTPKDPDVLPGTADVAAPDGPDDDGGTGYLWNQAMRAGLSVRNYGFFLDLSRYNLTGANAKYNIPEVTDPYKTHTQVAFPANAALAPVTDIYFRGFDNSFPDYFRYTEFARDFDARYAREGLPSLILLRFMHDHTGDFQTAIYHINTPERQQADDDYAVGLLVQKIAHSRYADSTLVFVIEDDSQDGADHIDTHRSIAFIVGPYVKHHAVVSTEYNTVDFIRTMEVILGLKPLNVSDAIAVPMADVFDIKQKSWTYSATASRMLVDTGLPLPPTVARLKPLESTHDAAYWANVTQGMNFRVEDDFNFGRYDRILWKGLMGSRPYPEGSTGLDLSHNRAALLREYKGAQGRAAKPQHNAGESRPSSVGSGD
jgi:YVTN family beta-propeller protein